MPCFLRQLFVCFVAVCAIALILTIPAQAQTASSNVNMVSGTQWPGGDPFLQRQNEPSLAVSSRNPLHLLSGANDYRTVDLPGLTDQKVVADAWLGLFKSYDGGQTWKSTLLPGYQQDSSAAGLDSPLKGLQGAADPVVRAGANGLLYYSGVAFDRSPNGVGKFFVARFIDNNNESADPIKYLGTSVIDSGTAGKFVDKPWMAVDIPRAGATSATIDGQTFPVGNVYVSWSIIQGQEPTITTKVYLARSTNGGTTWGNPVKLSESVAVSQGTSIAIDPTTGAVYVTWRRIKKVDAVTGAIVQTDALMTVKSTDSGKTFTAPSVISEINPFDQGTSGASMRTTAYPTIAADSTGRVYVAWSQRGVYEGVDARIVMSTSTNGTSWTTPFIVESPAKRGHQIMPALSFAGGKLMLIYYDLREDHTFGLFNLIPGSGGLFTETRFPFGDLAEQGANSPKVFTSFIMDAAPAGLGTLKRRHTLDVRATQANPAATPSFAPAIKVSQYKFGSRPGSNVIEQMQFNVPNLPMFRKGEVPFMGDYIDLATQAIIPNGTGGWTFNTAPSNSVVFHAVWTDNRDVIAPRAIPPASPDWTKYTPPNSAAKPTISRVDGSVVVPCIEGMTGMRNQNIYTSRITQGLFVGSPANAKLLNTTSKRSFVAYVQNATSSVKNYRLTIATQPVGGTASFVQFPTAGAVTSVDVSIAARSSISRTVYATSSDPRAKLTVNVAEITAPGGSLVSGGLTTSLILNGDATNPVNTGIATTEIFNPEIANPEIANPEIANPEIANPEIANPEIANPEIANPEIANPEIANGSMTDMTWTVRNGGNTAGAYAVKVFRNQPAPTGFKFQLIVTRATTVTSYVGCNLVSQRRYELVTNVVNPAFITSTTELSTPLLDATNAAITNASVYMSPGDEVKVTLRAVGPTADAVVNYLATSVAPAVASQAANTGTTTPPVVIAPLGVGTSALAEGVVSAPYSAELLATGGTSPFNWTLLSGALPTGLNLSGAGIISGTPTVAGTSTFTVKVTDGGSLNATRTLSILVNALPDATLSFLTQPINTPANQIISAPTGVQVRAVQGANPVQGLNVTINIGMNPGGGTLIGIATAATDGNGIASFPFLRITAAGNGYTLIASANASLPVTSNAFNIDVPAGSTLTFVDHPGNQIAGQPGPIVGVRAVDFTGAVLPGVPINIALGANPSGSTAGTLNLITSALGVARAPNLTLDRGGYGYTLIASAAGIPPLTSRPFNVEGFALTGSVNAPRYNHTATVLPDGKVLIAGNALPNASALAELYDPATKIFTPTGSMVAKRYQHQATLLPNGKVLMVGGYDDTLPGGGDSLASAEIYDPANGTFTATGSMSVERYSPTATLLPNGKVLVAGGVNFIVGGGFILNSGELYDPQTGMFSPVSNTMSDGRHGHTATLLSNGKVLLTGGSQGVFSADLYDPTTNSFAPTGSMTVDRVFHTATLLPNGKVLIVGGSDYEISGPTTRASAEIYDPATGIFTATGSLSVPRERHAATVLPNGTVLISGGIDFATVPHFTAEIFNPATGTFRTTDNMESRRGLFQSSTLLSDGTVLIVGGNESGSSSAEIFYPIDPPFRFETISLVSSSNVERYYHAATKLANGKVLITGGGSTIPGTPTIATAEIYDPATEVITFTGNMTTNRAYHTSTLLPNGKVLIAGGFDEGLPGGPDTQKSAELYDPLTGTFTATGSMTTKRGSATATLLPNGKVLITGGVDIFPPGGGGAVSNNDGEIYDPATGLFTPVSNLMRRRTVHTATLLSNGKVLLTGGTGSQNTADLYDPFTNSFSATGNLTTDRSHHAATLLPNGKVLLTSGFGAVNRTNTAEIYDPATGVFTATGSLLIPRANATATLLTNGTVLIAGGSNVPASPTLVEIYNPATGTFRSAGNLTNRRGFVPIATLLPNGKVLIAGGNDGPDIRWELFSSTVP